MNVITTAYRIFWKNKSNFSFLLFVLAVYIFAILPFLQENAISQAVFLAFYYFLLISSLPIIKEQVKRKVVVGIYVLPAIFLIIEIGWKAQWVRIITDLYVLVYCLFLAAIIFNEVFSKGKINSARVQGAVVVYLLIGVIFCLGFHSIEIISNYQAFHGLMSFHRKEFMYFSFCTLTTVGYGDVTPIAPLARSLANLEAFVGQLFPAIFIARIVSMDITDKGTAGK